MGEANEPLDAEGNESEEKEDVPDYERQNKEDDPKMDSENHDLSELSEVVRKSYEKCGNTYMLYCKNKDDFEKAKAYFSNSENYVFGGAFENDLMRIVSVKSKTDRVSTLKSLEEVVKMYGVRVEPSAPFKALSDDSKNQSRGYGIMGGKDKSYK